MKVWFTSDTHFGHSNIIDHAHRPYVDVESMNASMIERWNRVVRPEDIVYHLGDFALGARAKWPQYLSALNGKKILLLGNHDEKAHYMIDRVGFDDALDNTIVEVNGHRVWLNHYPIDNGDDPREYSRPAPPGNFDFAMCGHVHDRWRVRSNCVNVGVDVWDFRPISLDHAASALSSQQ